MPQNWCLLDKQAPKNHSVDAFKSQVLPFFRTTSRENLKYNPKTHVQVPSRKIA